MTGTSDLILAMLSSINTHLQAFCKLGRHSREEGCAWSLVPCFAGGCSRQQQLQQSCLSAKPGFCTCYSILFNWISGLLRLHLAAGELVEVPLQRLQALYGESTAQWLYRLARGCDTEEVILYMTCAWYVRTHRGFQGMHLTVKACQLMS